MINPKRRPVYLELSRIHQPIPAIVSVGHRISGLLLFLALAPLLYLFDLSVQGPEGYVRAVALLASLPMRLVLLLLFWVFFHHLFAGIRILFLDLEIGIEREQSRKSSKAVLLGGLVATLISAGWLL